ncbi:MAG: gamma-glutamylcyclotransferase family protein [Ilumatobacteraceae bacterium]
MIDAAQPVWVFGYGSLVAPESVATTIGRTVTPGDGFAPATLDDHERRWNYGSLRQRADWRGPYGHVAGGIVISLGVVRAEGEQANGAVVRVTRAELARLDRRESDYDRVDVTRLVRVDGDADVGPIVTYVPRRSAVERYRSARTDGRAAVRHGYVALVERAFADLGEHHLDRYIATTPTPDVPVVEFDAAWLEDRTDVR